jgi:hydrogenase maturation factor
MPPETPDEDFRTIIDSIHENADDLGIAIVGGHTGYYPGFMAPTIGGITVFAVCGKDEYITPAGAKAGDDVLLTKGPAVEAAGILAALQPEKLSAYPPELVERAKAMCQQMTVVKDALTAMEAGGVHAMHDATEGGVRGGLFEIASASSVGMEIDESLFIYPEEIRIVAEGFDFDPIEAIAEGTLLLAVDPGHTQAVLTALEGVDIAASVVGSCTDDESVRTIKRRSGSIEKLFIPVQDPFWPLFFEALGA